MCIGALMYRVPPENWAPEGFVPLAKTSRFISSGDVHLRDAHKTFSFWMIWGVLFLNVTAGIAVLSIASPMLQTIFGPALIGLKAGVKPDADQIKAIAAVAAGFVGLLSLFNIGGRFFWASMSDKIGRKATYFTFFVLGILLYASVPTLADKGSKALFVGALCIILSMYGGGFATVPAYLADIFGTKFVGAIHGRLLTAWSMAGIVGSEIIVGVRDQQIAAGVPKTEVYDAVMYVMAGLLALGFVCNLLIRPVDNKSAQMAYGPLGSCRRPSDSACGSDFGAGHRHGQPFRRDPRALADHRDPGCLGALQGLAQRREDPELTPSGRSRARTRP